MMVTVAVVKTAELYIYCCCCCCEVVAANCREVAVAVVDAFLLLAVVDACGPGSRQILLTRRGHWRSFLNRELLDLTKFV